MDGLTVKAAFIAVLATVALLLTGWRKPARAEHRSPRGTGFTVEHLDAPPYRRPGPIRRLLAVIASGGIGVLTGTLIAIITSFSIAAAVIWMTNLLR